MDAYFVKLDAVSQSLTLSTADADVCSLLQTDVTERCCVSVLPPFLRESEMRLCYLIDGRSGEKDLPANLCGTCLYHTGCPIYGDMIFVLCHQAETDETCFGMSRQQAEQLCTWLKTQFAFLH